MATRKGPDLVAVALANTMSTYLPGEIDAVNTAWNDAATVPALPHPKKYFSERRMEIPESPSLMIGMLPGQQLDNGAYSPAVGWATMVYGFEAILYFRGDKLHILERMARRYATAMWEVLMKYQALDDSIPGETGVMPKEWSPAAAQAEMGLEYTVTWSGQVYVVQDV